MAQQSTQGHKHKNKAAATHAHRKSSKLSKPSKSHKHSSHAAVQLPAKQSGAVQKPSKSKKTVSAAGVFKKAKHDGKKHLERKESEPDLKQEFRDGIEKARTAIDANLHASFNAIHENFLQKLAASRSRDVSFFESISATANMLSAPLAEEQIETTFTREGKCVTEIVEIGKRIEMFKKSVEKGEGKLKGFWAQWEELQDDFLELGVEVFGPEAFGAGEAEKREKGFKWEMEALDGEFDKKVLELTNEVGKMSAEVLSKMEQSEMELDASARRQQAKLLQALIAD